MGKGRKAPPCWTWAIAGNGCITYRKWGVSPLLLVMGCLLGAVVTEEKVRLLTEWLGFPFWPSI